MKYALTLSALLLTVACSREEMPEAPTAEESARLDDAEDMLNNMNLTAPENEEGATPEGTAPHSIGNSSGGADAE